MRLATVEVKRNWSSCHRIHWPTRLQHCHNAMLSLKIL